MLNRRTLSLLVGWYLPLTLFLVLSGLRVVWAQTNVELIIDDSGSMAAHVSGQTKISVAKQVLSQFVQDLPADANVAVRTYGRRSAASARDCNDLELLAPFSTGNRQALQHAVAELRPNGMTPIAASLQAAAKDFAGKEGQDNVIVLLTDGEEDCNGDPCLAAKAIHDAGIHLQTNVIGFNVKDKERPQLKCIADAGAGKYYDAKDAGALKVAASEVKARIEVPVATPAPTPAEFNLLSPSNGGQLVAAPDTSWAGIISGDDKKETEIALGGEAIFAFKGNQPATFSKFEVLVPAAAKWNIKEFEIFAADDSPTGNYRSLGKFTVQNIRMMSSPYQEFTFPETASKYFKFKVLSNYGGSNMGSTYMYQIRLVGKPGGVLAAPGAPASSVAEVNLLSPSSGGQLVAAPNPSWSQLIDGSEKETEVTLSDEAIFAFKDNKPASFSKFEVLIPSAAKWNVKEFELFAADDSPTGNYRSLGKFTAQNIRMMASPYQEFSFPVTTAKYFKFKILSNYGGSNMGSTYMYQIRLMATATK